MEECKIIEAYKAGKSMTAIAKEASTYTTSIRRILIRNNVELRHDGKKKGELYVEDGEKLIEWAKAQGRLVTRTELATVIGKSKLSPSYFEKYPELGKYVKGRINIQLQKYTEQVAEKILSINNTLEPLIEENNSTFAIRVEHYHYATKKKEEATEFYHIDKDATEGVRIIKELKDPNDTHKYSMKACLKELNKRITRDGIQLLYNGQPAVLNQYHFTLFNSYFKIKENEKFCYVYQISAQPQYSYSQQAIDFIYDEIKKAPSTLLDDLKKRCSKK